MCRFLRFVLKKFSVATLFLCCSLFLTGCCSIIHGTSQKIPVNSVPSGATVFHNGIPAGTTPAILELKRSENHTIRVEKEGFVSYEESLVRSTSGWVWGNIFFGGLIGLAVDAIDGSIYNVKPDRISATLLPDPRTETVSLEGENAINTPPSIPTDQTSRLRILKKLHEEGLLTDEEYQTKKQDVLDDL